MARKKVTLQYIPTKSTRRATFRKRSQGLMKKAGEVATLCDAKACIVVYGEGELVPRVFPSHDEAVCILNRFRRLTECKQLNKKTDQESFLHKRIGKIQDQSLKYERECEEREKRFLVHKTMLQGHVGLSIQDLTNVGCKVDELLHDINDRIAKICGQPPVYQPSQDHAPTPYATGATDIIGVMTHAQTPPQQEEELLDPMRSRGGDLGSSVSDGFNSGPATRATAGLNVDEMMHPSDMGIGFSCPWGDTDPNMCLSSFPPM